MAKYTGDFTPEQKAEMEYVANAIKICKKNREALSEKLGASSSKKRKTKAEKVEYKKHKEDYERYTKQLNDLQQNMTDILEAREKFDEHIRLATLHLDAAEELNKKWRFKTCRGK